MEGEGAKVLYSNVSVASIREDRRGLTDAILGRAVARMPDFRIHSFIGADETHIKQSDRGQSIIMIATCGNPQRKSNNSSVKPRLDTYIDIGQKQWPVSVPSIS